VAVTSEVVKNRANTHGAVREGERDLMNGRLLIDQNENGRNLNGLWEDEMIQKFGQNVSILTSIKKINEFALIEERFSINFGMNGRPRSLRLRTKTTCRHLQVVLSDDPPVQMNWPVDGSGALNLPEHFVECQGRPIQVVIFEGISRVRYCAVSMSCFREWRVGHQPADVREDFLFESIVIINELENVTIHGKVLRA
jgi:hypothetical protein